MASDIESNAFFGHIMIFLSDICWQSEVGLSLQQVYNPLLKQFTQNMMCNVHFLKIEPIDVYNTDHKLLYTKMHIVFFISFQQSVY